MGPIDALVCHAGNVERENKITQDILARYLQRRLFPSKRQLPAHENDEESEGSERVNNIRSLEDEG